MLSVQKISNLEIPGIEPGAFHMQSERATTALYPLYMELWIAIYFFFYIQYSNSFWRTCWSRKIESYYKMSLPNESWHLDKLQNLLSFQVSVDVGTVSNQKPGKVWFNYIIFSIIKCWFGKLENDQFTYGFFFNTY